jgi:hypothetical protein
LNSMMWANASPPARFIGSRCKVSRPTKNQYGRIINPVCWDNNPATYYLALTNQIGRHKRSFVMDTTYDAQVWNFSIGGYTSVYFNPQSLRPTYQLSSAIIPIEKFTLDKFKEFRSKNAKYIVGIAMDVDYVAAMNPSHKVLKETKFKTYRYIYDLELDADLNVIGGEWYANAHPDFIWTFDSKAEAKSTSEEGLDPKEWNITGPVPQAWTAAAQKASVAGKPLSIVIKRIVDGELAEEEEGEGEDPTHGEEEEVPTPDTPSEEAIPEPVPGTPEG